MFLGLYAPRISSHLLRAAAITVVCSTLTITCGKSVPMSAAPSPTLTVVSIVIVGLISPINVGHTVSYSAKALLSDGSTRPVTGVWGADSPTVVSMSTDGVLTPLSPGLATIWVDAEGRRGTLVVNVTLNVTGTLARGA